jgi:hypothetical protein
MPLVLVPGLVLDRRTKTLFICSYYIINTSGTGKRVVYGKKTPQLGFTKVLI